MSEPTFATGLDPIWLVKMPIHKYYEESGNEAKMIARKAGVRIVNAKFAGIIADEFLAKNPPKLTEKGAAEKPKPKRKPAKKKEPEETNANSGEEAAEE